MLSLIAPAAIAAVVFVGFLLLLTSQVSSDTDRRKKSLLDRVSKEHAVQMSGAKTSSAAASLFKNEAQALPTTGFIGMLCSLPGVRSTHELLMKAGLGNSIGSFMLVAYMVFLVMIIGCYMAGVRKPLLLFFVPLLGAFILVRKNLRGRIRKRNEKFLLLFPDAVDMIVRSVRSGHPLNTALRMIAENMEDPVREEFKQVVDEISYGRTLPEALQRLAQRVGEQDIHFFVVVLSVQQETGGSLAEVLTNLSTIIRKRRQLRLKIRALTSEGRATSYILGAIPFVEIAALKFITPNYLDPLFSGEPLGYIIFGSAMFMIFSAILIVRRMANIDI